MVLQTHMGLPLASTRDQTVFPYHSTPHPETMGLSWAGYSATSRGVQIDVTHALDSVRNFDTSNRDGSTGEDTGGRRYRDRDMETDTDGRGQMRDVDTTRMALGTGRLTARGELGRRHVGDLESQTLLEKGPLKRARAAPPPPPLPPPLPPPPPPSGAHE